jgi:hypothetical protein
MSNLEDSAQALGIKLDDVQESEGLKKEKRYCFIIHILRGKESYIGTTKEPHPDFKEAKRIAINRLKQQLKRIKKHDIISFKCLEFTYCDVPIDSVLKGMIYKMQPVSNRWMTPEEIEELVTK